MSLEKDDLKLSFDSLERHKSIFDKVRYPLLPKPGTESGLSWLDYEDLQQGCQGLAVPI
jgi:hypothetical protein